MRTPLQLDLRIDDDHWLDVKGCEGLVTRSLSAALHMAERPDTPVAVTVILADNDTVQQLNRHWRQKDKPTNILSFPAPAGERDESGADYLGDLILAHNVVADEANSQGKPLATHLCHLVIHGTLHLLGFDHIEESGAKQMEQLEIAAMKQLGLPDPYFDTQADFVVNDT